MEDNQMLDFADDKRVQEAIRIALKINYVANKCRMSRQQAAWLLYIKGPDAPFPPEHEGRPLPLFPTTLSDLADKSD